MRARVCVSGGMKRRHPGCALLLSRMRLVKAVPDVISCGRGNFPLLMAMMATVILASSEGLEKGSHASVGVDRLKPMAYRRKVEEVFVVKASSDSGGKTCRMSFRTMHLNLLSMSAMLGRMWSLCWAVMVGGVQVMA